MTIYGKKSKDWKDDLFKDLRVCKIKIIIFFLSFFFYEICFAIEEQYKLTNIQPKDLVRQDYKLHNVIPIESEGLRVMLYTFIKDNFVVSCVVELDAMFADGHICYNVTNKE